MSLIHCQTDRRHFCVYMRFFIIFIMGVYNVVIHTGGLQATAFKHALQNLVVGPFCRFIFLSL